MDGEASGPGTAPGQPAFRHAALLYHSAAELAAVAAPFLLDGLTAGDTVVLSAGPAATATLRAALHNAVPAAGDGDPGGRSAAAPGLLVVDRGDLYCPRTPAALTAFRALIARLGHGGARRVRLVGEVDFGDTGEQHLEWQRFEAVLNHALAGLPLSLLCLFDARRLPQPVLAAAGHTHPRLARPADPRPDPAGPDTGAGGLNPGYSDPADYLRALPVPREPLEQTPPRLAAEDVADFTGLRHALRVALDTVEGPRDRLEDFLLAVDEMTSNALRHGRPPIAVRLWTSPGAVVATITDTGTEWDNPYAGYGPAHGADLSHGGMGLWLARQLCDHVAIRHTPDGVTVRLTARWAARRTTANR